MTAGLEANFARLLEELDCARTRAQLGVPRDIRAMASKPEPDVTDVVRTRTWCNLPRRNLDTFLNEFEHPVCADVWRSTARMPSPPLSLALEDWASGFRSVTPPVETKRALIVVAPTESRDQGREVSVPRQSRQANGSDCSRPVAFWTRISSSESTNGGRDRDKSRRMSGQRVTAQADGIKYFRETSNHDEWRPKRCCCRSGPPAMR